jgi:hypothetical protein
VAAGRSLRHVVLVATKDDINTATAVAAHAVAFAERVSARTQDAAATAVGGALSDDAAAEEGAVEEGAAGIGRRGGARTVPADAEAVPRLTTPSKRSARAAAAKSEEGSGSAAASQTSEDGESAGFSSAPADAGRSPKRRRLADGKHAGGCAGNAGSTGPHPPARATEGGAAALGARMVALGVHLRIVREGLLGLERAVGVGCVEHTMAWL